MHSLTLFFILFDFSTPDKDNEHSPELTQTSSVLARPFIISLESREAQSQSIICFTIFISFKKWCLCWHCFHLQKRAPSIANTEVVLANHISTAHLEPFPETEPALGVREDNSIASCDQQQGQIQQILYPHQSRLRHLFLSLPLHPPSPLIW